jgi:hypothetical protein
MNFGGGMMAVVIPRALVDDSVQLLVFSYMDAAVVVLKYRQL